jgi:hydrogenase expression/formation protein HypC
MCLAVPAKVVELEGPSALVDVQGNRVAADVTLLREVSVGDYVLVHAGFAIRRYEREEAEEVLALLAEAFPEGL